MRVSQKNVLDGSKAERNKIKTACDLAMFKYRKSKSERAPAYLWTREIAQIKKKTVIRLEENTHSKGL